VTLATLAIHAEAWLQEELAAQREVLATLERTEAAARAGKTAELESSGEALRALLAPAAARDERRAGLRRRMAAALGVPERQVDLGRLCARLDAERVDARRIQGQRGELRELATRVVHAGRRLAAMAQYHRGVFEELCQVLKSGAPAGQDHLIDARA